jgi:hypothetical protein
MELYHKKRRFAIGERRTGKVEAVMAGGGVAALVYNNAPGGLTGTLGDEGAYIPAVSTSRQDRLFLVVETDPSCLGSLSFQLVDQLAQGRAVFHLARGALG